MSDVFGFFFLGKVLGTLFIQLVKKEMLGDEKSFL